MVCLPPFVSVVIPAYNAAALIERCIESVVTQSGSFAVELIVVDDGSTDETVPIVQRFAHERISLIRQENQGPAAARNAGLEKATGRYVAFLDADDYWRPGFLQKTVAFLDARPEVVAVNVGQMHKSIGKPPAVVPRFLLDPSSPREPQVLDRFFAFWARHNHVHTSSVLMRTDVVRETGGLRTELRICEDLEFWAYLATFGKWGFIPEVLSVSDGGAVTRRQGWLAKNRPRWASAPTVEEWQARVVTRLDPRELDDFRAARARVAKNLAYSMVLSGRDRLAKNALAYVDPGTADRVGRLLLRASGQGAVAWKGTCSFLRLREVARDSRMRIHDLWARRRSASSRSVANPACT